jgi:hypothetical protein
MTFILIFVKLECLNINVFTARISDKFISFGIGIKTSLVIVNISDIVI